MRGWLTGDTLPTTGYTCRRLLIPNDLAMLIAVNGALLDLTKPENWEQEGVITPDEAAAAMEIMWEEYVDSACSMIGSIVLYATTIAPIGTLLCDGATYNRVDYPALYAVLSAGFILTADTFKTPAQVGHDDLNYFIVSS